jgi:hypothetical protein
MTGYFGRNPMSERRQTVPAVYSSALGSPLEGDQ